MSTLSPLADEGVKSTVLLFVSIKDEYYSLMKQKENPSTARPRVQEGQGRYAVTVCTPNRKADSNVTRMFVCVCACVNVCVYVRACVQDVLLRAGRDMSVLIIIR